MMNTKSVSAKFLKSNLVFKVFLLSCSVFITSCDLAKNQLKVDRATDMEVQDYRDSFASRVGRQDDLDDASSADASIPEMKPYISDSAEKLKPMPLVSVSVNQTIPLRDVLYEVAKQASYDIELDPRIEGSIIFTANNKPFDSVIERISDMAGLRYKFSNDSVKIEMDMPYHEIYKVSYYPYSRKITSSVTNDLSIGGGGAGSGSKFQAEVSGEADFWGDLDRNLTQILSVNQKSRSLVTSQTPQVTTSTGQSAPVEPVLLQADGEIATGDAAAGAPGDVNAGQSASATPPEAVLNVQPIPTEETAATESGEEDPYAPRYSINKQAGVISIFANQKTQKLVSSYIHQVKKIAESQVLIEAKVLEVSLSDEFATGIDWSRTNLFGSTADFGVQTTGVNAQTGTISSLQGTIAPAFDPVSSPSLGALATYVKGNLSVAVEAMQRFGTVHALASPRLTVLNNQGAVLSVAKNQVYFELTTTYSPATTDAAAVFSAESEIKTVPEGVLINVMPTIDLDTNTVSMTVRPSVTKITGYVNDPGVSLTVAQAAADGMDVSGISSPVPIVNVQEFDSVINVASGQPIILGGLLQDNATSEQNAVPVLGEVPLVGSLFRNQGDSLRKSEIVVFLKATIVNNKDNIDSTDKDIYRTFSQDRRPFKM